MRRNEILVDPHRMLDLVEAARAATDDDTQLDVPLGPRSTQETVVTQHYMLGSHPRTRQVRVIRTVPNTNPEKENR